MFTGIIQAVGKVASITSAGKSATLCVEAKGVDLSDVAIGDSIAVNGICLTVTKRSAQKLEFDVSQETLRVTAGFEKGVSVNLEKSLRLSDRLGGHLVSGHVDGVGEVIAVKPVDSNREITVRFPQELARFFAAKGSVALNGVSLTVNTVAGGSFSLNLIPHTLSVTNLKSLAKGSRVNLEVDLVARYVERILEQGDHSQG